MNNTEEQTTNEAFILSPDAREDTTEAVVTPTAARFSVVPHLILIACILLGLFSTIVIPKAISYLPIAAETPREIVPLPDVAAVTSSVDPFANVTLTAEAAYVWDISNQRSLYTKNAETVLPLASITKLMTTLVSYQLVEDETIVTVSPEAAAQESGGFFMVGEQFKAKELADFALISSYNSAAYALADSVGALLGNADPTEQFVAAMNVTADELGLSTLEFYNPTGLDVSATRSGGYGTAAEVSRLMEYIVENYPEILIPTVTPQTILYNTAGYTHEAENTNDIITEIPNVLGSKTGYTDLAGGNLTVVFDAGFNRHIVITVLGSTRSARFSDMRQLITAVTAAVTPNP
jgi:D-alanyl-D-alanine carboxypeptidase